MAVGRTMADALRIGMGIFVLFSCTNCAPVDGDEREESILALEQAPEWTFCARNEQHCMFSGTREVRYGAGLNWTTKTFTNEVHCSGAAFGVRSRYRFRCEYNAAEPVDDMPTDEMPTDMPHEHDMADAGMGTDHEMPADAGTGTVHDMPMNLMPYVDESAIPIGSPGTSKALVRPTTEVAPTNEAGAFRTVCKYSHMNFDDPIVFPGKERASHLHVFFGNTLTDASSTAQSLATTGNSTCRGGIVNRSAYWVPALLDSRGRPQAPTESNFYYKSASLVPSTIKPFPQGLRMIAGSAKAQGPQDKVYWGCFETYKGHFSTIPSVCPVGEHIQMSIDFPQCWNGVDLDSTDHKSHMAYAVNGACPSTHPVPLPSIAFNILYKVPPEGMAGWRLSSDMYDPSLPGGYSVHGDWFAGWDPEVSKAFVEKCTAASRDCHSHLLGDGREIYDF